MIFFITVIFAGKPEQFRAAHNGNLHGHMFGHVDACSLILKKDFQMKPGESLLKKLAKKYEPSAMVSMRFRGADLRFKTDEEGNPSV